MIRFYSKTLIDFKLLFFLATINCPTHILYLIYIYTHPKNFNLVSQTTNSDIEKQYIPVDN